MWSYPSVLVSKFHRCWVQVKGFQVNALLRKSWAYQRKNISLNVCSTHLNNWFLFALVLNQHESAEQ